MMRVRRPSAAFWLVLPAMVLMGVFFVLPIVASLLLSFTDFDLYALARWDHLRLIGFENYRRLFTDPLFFRALTNTFYFVALGAPLSILASLFFALLINQRMVCGQGFFRTVFFLPVVTTLVAVAVVWRYLYHPRSGLLNYVLSLFGIEPMDWLGDPDWAMPSLIIMAVWKNFGFNMVIFIAGLKSIPRRLYEAAEVDGAGAFDQFRSITLPLLAPTFVFVVIVTLIGYFQLFAEPYVMTQGGPSGRTLSIALLMFEEGFRWWNLGYAAAISFVLFLIILSGTLIQMCVRRLL
jgi:multiple sugar transport system permease protein